LKYRLLYIRKSFRRFLEIVFFFRSLF